MSKFKFINIIDTAFLSILTFLIIFAWVQFFAKNLLLSLFVSAILAIAVMLGARWLKSRKYNASQQIIANNANLIKFKLTVQTMPTAKLASMIKRLIPTKYLAKTNKGDIVFTKDTQSFTFTFYYSTPLNEAKVLELIKTKTADNLAIFCSSHDKEAKLVSTAFKNKKIELVDLEQLYQIFNQNNIALNTDHIDLNKSKITLKEILKNSLSRDKSKGYFISGLVLLFTSIIIPYRIYYVVFSSVLFLLSLLCRLKPATKVNHSLFD